MKRSRVRKLFLAAFVVLPLQYALVGLGSVVGIGEPWPAVVLPGFKAVWDDASAVSVPQASFHVHFSDGSMAKARPADVFAAIPASHHLGIMRRQFMPARLSGTRRTERGRRARSRIWLRHRLRELYDGHDAEHVNVVWNEVRYRRGNEPEIVALDTLYIDLEP